MLLALDGPVAFGAVETAIQTCYRHPDRRAGVVCQRCDRPICPDCMNQASVGFHCPDCTRAGAQSVVRPGQLVSRPIVTNVLIALNLAVFVAGLTGSLGTSDEMVRDGGLVGSFPGLPGIGVANGEWWRMLTSGFLHAGLLHVAFNCLVLYQLGQLLEPLLGRVQFTAIYFASMLTGSFGVLLLDPQAFTVGASGAVFGLMGAALAVFRSRGINPFDTGLGGAVMINLLITFAIPRISIGGHVGGLIGGFIAGWILAELGPKHLRSQPVATALVAVLGMAAAAGGILVA